MNPHYEAIEKLLNSMNFRGKDGNINDLNCIEVEGRNKIASRFNLEMWGAPQERTPFERVLSFTTKNSTLIIAIDYLAAELEKSKDRAQELGILLLKLEDRGILVLAETKDKIEKIKTLLSGVEKHIADIKKRGDRTSLFFDVDELIKREIEENDYVYLAIRVLYRKN